MSSGERLCLGSEKGHKKTWGGSSHHGGPQCRRGPGDASSAADYIMGQVLSVNGGLTMA